MGREKKGFKNQRGFTLIEIIAVLIILGILAAVAVPKYFDLQVDAAKASLKSAVAELNARENMWWAKYKSGGEAPYNALPTVEQIVDDFGDFSVNTGTLVLTSNNTNITLQLLRIDPTESSPGLWTFDDDTGWGGV